MNSTKTGLVPDEDQGLVFVAVSTAPGNSLYATDGIMNRVEERIQQIPQVKQVLKVTGWSMGGAGNSSGIFFVRLTPWDERPEEEDHSDPRILQPRRSLGRQAGQQGYDTWL